MRAVEARAATASSGRRHPPETARPIFWCLPDLVNGIPMLREMRAFAPLIPTNRFQENPPLFIAR